MKITVAPCRFLLLIILVLGFAKLSYTFRYWTDDGEFTIRNVVHLEHGEPEATNIQWRINVPRTMCTIDQLPSGNADMQCQHQELFTVTLQYIKNGIPFETSRLIWLEYPRGCYQWYMVEQPACSGPRSAPSETIGSCDIGDSSVPFCVWVMDRLSCSQEEKNHTAQYPSELSEHLTKQFHLFGQEPVVRELEHGLYSRPLHHTAKGFNQEKCCWEFEVELSMDKELQLLVDGEVFALYECMVRETFVSFPKPFVVEHFDTQNKTKKLISRNDLGIIKHPCHDGIAVFVTEDGDVLWTRDGFYNTGPVEITLPEIPHLDLLNVSRLVLASSYLVLLADELLVAVDVEMSNPAARVLQEGIKLDAIKGRDWCSDQDDRKETNDMFLGWTEDTLFLYTLTSLDNLSTVAIPAPTVEGQQTHIMTAAFSTLSNRLGVVLNTSNSLAEQKIDVYFYSLNTETWTWLFRDNNSTPGYSYNLVFLWSGLSKLVLWSGPNIHFYTYEDVNHQDMYVTADLDSSIIKHVATNLLGELVFVDSGGRIHYTTAYWDSVVDLNQLASASGFAYPWFDGYKNLYMLTAHGGRGVEKNKYPVMNEVVNVFYPDLICHFQPLETGGMEHLYTMDIDQNIILWASLSYPIQDAKNTSMLELFVDGEMSLVNISIFTTYTLHENYIEENLLIKFKNNEAIDIRSWRDQKGQIGFEVRPSEIRPLCPLPAHRVSFISVGCETSLNIKVNGTTDPVCGHFNQTSYTIPGSNGTSENLEAAYDFVTLGCPLRADRDKPFLPQVLICHDDVCKAEMMADFVIWEENNQPFTYNTTMAQAGCLQEAQTWSKMSNSTTINYMSWSPKNYESCFVFDNETQAEVLTQNYEILNMSRHVSLKFPEDMAGMYIFHIRVIDPQYSYCTLETVFAVEVWGTKPKENIKVLGTSVLVWISLVILMLVFSYVYFREEVYFQMED